MSEAVSLSVGIFLQIISLWFFKVFLDLLYIYFGCLLCSLLSGGCCIFIYDTFFLLRAKPSRRSYTVFSVPVALPALNDIVVDLILGSCRTAEVGRNLQRSSGPTFHGKGSLGEVI